MHYFDGVNYIEEMLRKQIIAAIGKEVTPVDFANYMVYHNRKVRLLSRPFLLPPRCCVAPFPLTVAFL